MFYHQYYYQFKLPILPFTNQNRTYYILYIECCKTLPASDICLLSLSWAKKWPKLAFRRVSCSHLLRAVSMSLCSKYPEYSLCSQSNILQLWLYQGDIYIYTSHDPIWTGVTRALAIIYTTLNNWCEETMLAVSFSGWEDIYWIGVSKLVGPVNVKGIYCAENSVQASVSQQIWSNQHSKKHNKSLAPTYHADTVSRGG